MIQTEPHSYRDAPSVPPFDDAGPVAVLDAQCGLCSKAALWIARNDHGARVRFVPIQSPLGAALARHYGVDPEDPATWLLLDNGHAMAGLDAALHVSRYLGPWRALGLFRGVPAPLRNVMYRVIARNRYRVFGRADLCALPDPEIQRRLLR